MGRSICSSCPMKLIVQAVSEDDPRGPWKIVHSRNHSGLHNHPPSLDSRVHPGQRLRAAAEATIDPVSSLQGMVEAQTAVGISTGSIQASFTQTDPETFIIPQGIANMRNVARRRVIASQTAI
ncbi:unnamed protein product [Phytophthora fragariaefolia]|uniref:Unnamed protein product n=1 Tax=Phytophthora fragariaefolia TaxID=1490495 RepID=A0A9W6XJJ1_9STRA|nr:unnamed protein product [Phytophthora fragariaefolia]